MNAQHSGWHVGARFPGKYAVTRVDGGPPVELCVAGTMRAAVAMAIYLLRSRTEAQRAAGVTYVAAAR